MLETRSVNVQVTVEPSLVKQIDKIADANRQSRSSQMWIWANEAVAKAKIKKPKAKKG